MQPFIWLSGPFGGVISYGCLGVLLNTKSGAPIKSGNIIQCSNLQNGYLDDLTTYECVATKAKLANKSHYLHRAKSRRDMFSKVTAKEHMQ